MSFGKDLCAKSLALTKKVKYEQKIDQLLSFEMATQMLEKIEREVSEVYINEKLSKKEKAQRAFEIYLQHRLKLLDPSDEMAVLDVIKNRNRLVMLTENEFKDFNSETRIQSFYDDEGRELQVTTPEKYVSTFLEFVVRAHELEHAIQHLVVGEMPSGVIHPKFYSVWLFGREKGAMIAESIYIKAIPRSEREEMLKQLLSDEPLPKAFRAIYINVINASLVSSDLSGYVSRQWEDWRYNQKSIVVSQVITSGLAASIMAPAVWHIIHQLIP